MQYAHTSHIKGRITPTIYLVIVGSWHHSKGNLLLNITPKFETLFVPWYYIEVALKKKILFKQ